MTQTPRLVACSFLALLAASEGAAQVSISPPILVLSDAARITDFTVGNTSDQPQEVTIDFRFGYMRSDSLGNLAMQYEDSAAAARYSTAGWTGAFPRRFLLPPGAEQTVRITARPPRELPPGTYWTRLITASMPQSAAIDSLAPGVSTQITVRLEQVSTVLFRRGEAPTGVNVGDLVVHRDSAGTHLLIPLVAQHGSPLLGTATVRFKDERGTLVHEVRTKLAVYFEQVHRVTLPATAAPGAYTAEVSIEAGRADVPTWTRGSSPPVAARLQFTVQ